MTDAELRTVILGIAMQNANDYATAQEGPVLAAVRCHFDKILLDLQDQQLILCVWQDLFIDGILVWGYDLEHYGWPFYHVRYPVIPAPRPA